MCGASHLIAYLVAAVHPPFPVLVVFFMLAGFGNGLADAGWNAWIGDMEHANEILGLLHGFYGLGAVISPLIATTMITKGNLLWYDYYYIMVVIPVCFCRIHLADSRNNRLGLPLSN